MPIEVSWFVPGRVVLARGYGIVTRDENTESDRLVMQYIDRGTPPVHVIIDVTPVDDFPMYTAQEEIQKSREFLKHQQLGWGILCGTSNPVVRFLVSIVTRISRVNFRMFENYDEALQFLKEHDQSINLEISK